MAESITIARPYAQAAFEQAQKLSDLKGWSAFLLSLAEIVANPDVNSVMSNPRVIKSQLQAVMLDLIGKDATDQQQNFVKILVENRRLQVVAEIVVIFESLRAEAEKAINVVVDSAFELTAEQQNKIIASLKARMNREIKLECNVNKELLGGIVIRAGDKVIDGSARSRLGEMANALAR